MPVMFISVNMDESIILFIEETTTQAIDIREYTTNTS